MEFDFADLGSARPPVQWTAHYDPTTGSDKNKTKRSKAPRHSKKAASIPHDTTGSHSGTPSDVDSPDLCLTRYLSGGAPEHFLDMDLPPHLLNFGRQLRRQREFSGPPLLTAESEDGFVEYKLRIASVSSSRFEQLVTQLKFRLSEGNGQCFYFLGVEDNGHPRGLEPEELATSLAALEAMATEVSALVAVTGMPPGTEGRRCAVVRVHCPHAAAFGGEEVRVAVAGGAENGKSTLVAVLTRGCDGRPTLDNGRGAARMSVLRHKHEIESGRTSCVSHQLLGYDDQGAVLNYTRLAALDPGELAHSATRIVRLCDLGGHERFLKTSLHGITSTRPDYIMLCVCASTGLSTTTLEHFSVALALGIPPLLAVTKSDTMTPEQRDLLTKEIAGLVYAARMRMRMYAEDDTSNHSVQGEVDTQSRCQAKSDSFTVVETLEQAQAVARAMSSLRRRSDTTCDLIVPIFYTSSTAGTGIDLLHAFFNNLGGGKEEKGESTSIKHALRKRPSAITASPKTHFQIDHVFSDVAGVGTVLSGVVVRGSFRVGDLLLYGPGEGGQFRHVRVASIHRCQVTAERACAGQHATVAIEAPLETSPASDTETTKSPVSADIDLDSSASSLANFAFFCEEGSSGGDEQGTSPLSPLMATSRGGFYTPTPENGCLLSMGSSDSELGCFRESKPRDEPAMPSPATDNDTATVAANAPPIHSSSSSSSISMRVIRSVDSHPPTTCKSRESLEELSVFWEFAQELHLGSATTTSRARNHGRKGAAAGSQGGRKGTVLLDTAVQPKVSRTFDAILVILGGHWPPAVGRETPLISSDDDEGEGDLACDGDSQTISHSGCARGNRSRSVGTMSGSDGASETIKCRIPEHARASRGVYSPVVHCGSVRQAASVVDISGYPHPHLHPHPHPPTMEVDSAMGHKEEEHADVEVYWTPSVARACMAAVGVLTSSSCCATSATPLADQQFAPDSSGTGISSVVRVSFKFLHRSEWLLPGARLLVRDQVSGRVAGAGVVVATSGDGE